ncbi:unnamed protein product [Pseudo-nitzschia multistriata]|uniref:Plastid lipid-associated protein/fibrillin conserved domain-containing protein n=1 Tax=Pseudo-nitzschia multistriata TaxID=183589 RepID=A0A448ZI15_9STRA|nr:unnamed protein product [Pseudo-nitzschia multistriata]
MKLLSCLLVGFKWQQRSQLTPNTFYVGGQKGKTSTGFQSQLASSSVSVEDRNEKLSKVLSTAENIGQVGYLASEEDQLLMEEVAKEAIPFSLDKPGRFQLKGEHQLVYSAAEGASSGRVFGNVVGKVSQLFEDDETFYNRVRFGPLEISLRAKREIKNDSTIKVTFLETSFNLFGKTLKKGEVSGGGVWKVKFVGEVEDEKGGKKLVRIMETPSLFILEQDL